MCSSIAKGDLEESLSSSSRSILAAFLDAMVVKSRLLLVARGVVCVSTNNTICSLRTVVEIVCACSVCLFFV